MSGKIIIDDQELDSVVGGFFDFNTYTGIMTYTHKDGSTTEHKILNARKAWETSNQMHGQLVPEDEILKELVDKGYIGG